TREEMRGATEPEAGRRPEAKHRQVRTVLVHGLGEREDRLLGGEGDGVPERGEGEGRPAPAGTPRETAEDQKHEETPPGAGLEEGARERVVQAIDHQRVRPQEEAEVIEVG